MAGRHQGSAGERRALDAYIKLLRCTDHLEAWLARRLHERGLTLAQLAVLECLLHCGPLGQSELAAKMLRSGGSVTSLIDHLERKELVRRERCEEDRRVIHVHLTSRGRELIEETFPSHAADITRALDCLTAREQETLAALGKKLGLGVAALEE